MEVDFDTDSNSTGFRQNVLDAMAEIAAAV
jgi:hypothetical protein